MHLRIEHFFSLIFIFCLSLINLGCDSPEEEQSFADWDVNADDYVDEDEFKDRFLASDYVSDWDMDGDGQLTYGELYDVHYNLWDFDKDDALGEQEWRNALDTYFPDYDQTIYGDFEDWDLNNDDIITKNEFMEAILDTDLLEEVDINKDKMITEQEMTQAVYEYWDTDGDGYIEAVEFEKWEPVFSDM